MPYNTNLSWLNLFQFYMCVTWTEIINVLVHHGESQKKSSLYSLYCLKAEWTGENRWESTALKLAQQWGKSGLAHGNQKDKSVFRKRQDKNIPVNIQNTGHVRRPLF